MEAEFKHPNVSIIIVNWNGHHDTIECLESVYQIDYLNYDVILVDNGSKKLSIDKIRKYCNGDLEINSEFFEYNAKNKPIKIYEYTKEELNTVINGKKEDYSSKKLILIKNDKNYGFAEGNNIGIKYANKYLNPEYLLLLNNDTVVEKNFLSYLIKCDEKNKKIAAIQSAIHYYNNKYQIESIGKKFNLYNGRQPSIIKIDGNIIDCDVLNGAAMLIRRSAIEEIGLIDDQYFLYMEETDWCFRAKENGYNLRACKKSKVWHKIYSSSGGKINPKLLYYWNRNILLFYRKEYKKYLPTFLPFYIVRIIYLIGKFSLKLDFKAIKGIIYGVIDGIVGKKGKLKHSL